MAVKDEKTEKSRRSRMNKSKKQTTDRLSLLPDDILIVILSRLPIQSAIKTGTLSSRWDSLWKNLTSIHMINSNFSCLPNFFTAIFQIIMQIRSPFIQSFSVEFGYLPYYSENTIIDPWLRLICERNVCQLKLKGPLYQSNPPRLPEFILKAQSLVSLELSSSFDLQFPDQINLPNLKNLRLVYRPSLACTWLEKLTLACPSLEELSLNFGDYTLGQYYTSKCSNQNLRRLFINMKEGDRNTVLINAPKLDYLSVCVPNSTSVLFGEDPVVLREVKIKFNAYDRDSQDEENIQMLKFYQGIRNVEILTLKVFKLDNTTVFCNATRVTLNLKSPRNLKTMLSFLELCPVLDFLTLKYHDIGVDDEHYWILPSPGFLNTVGQVLKRIEIETHWYNYCKPTKTFIMLIEYLLSNTINLEHLKFGVIDDPFQVWEIEATKKEKVKSELMLCKFLYQCPMASMEGEVEFVGNFLNMSRKAGPYVRKANGKLILF